MYLCREIGNFSLPKIGYEFGKRDHTTVMHACSKIDTEIKNNYKLKNKINVIATDGNWSYTRLIK